MDNIAIVGEKCCGCGACLNSCPKDAIVMAENYEGFLEPHVDETKCMSCKKCLNVCPPITESNFNTVKTAYAVICNDDIRHSCSSGGAFGAIAEWAVEHGGTVFGAAYTNDFRRVEHIKATAPEELKKLYKSKYLQSDINRVYQEVKNTLEGSEAPVVFCGCPCQTDALQKFLGKKYKNLFVADIMCHGVVSPGAYGKFLDETFDGVDSPVKNVDFRSKELGWSYSFVAETENGTKLTVPSNSNYFNAFLWGYSKRKACFQCKYAQKERVSDITIGDFWGIDELSPEMNDQKGTSLVLCSTEKGIQLLENLRPYISKIEKYDYSDVLKIAEKVNWAIVKPRVMPPTRNVFFYRLLKGDTFSQAFKYASTSEFDVGIFGWWFEDDWSNYGSTLTYYALMEYVSSLGLTVYMITSPFHRKENASKFISEHGYRMTPTYSFEEFNNHNKNINTFLIGSDQIWFYHYYKEWGHSLFLDFVSDEKKKIAYATSFAHSDPQIPDDEIPKLKKLLDRFDGISVRENEGVRFLREKIGIDSIQNIDPVFLCKDEDWNRISNEAERKMTGKFLFAYILDPTEDKINALKYVSEQLNLPIVSVADKQHNTAEKIQLLRDCGVLINASISELIYHFKNAAFIVTNSYQGTCFSLIFRKSFITMNHKNGGASRFETLDELFGIGSRFVNDPASVIENKELLTPVDYSEIVPKIEQAANKGKAWLSSQLLNKRAEKNTVLPDSQENSLEKSNSKRIIFELQVLNHLGYSIGQYLIDNNITSVSVYCSEKYLDIFEALLLSLQCDDNITVNGFYSEKAFTYEHPQSFNLGLAYFQSGLPEKENLLFVSDGTIEFNAPSCNVLSMTNVLWKALEYAMTYRPVVRFKQLHPDVNILCVRYPSFPPEGKRDEREIFIQEDPLKYYFTEIQKELPQSFSVFDRAYSHEDWCELFDTPKSEIDIHGKRIYFDYESKLINIKNNHRITYFQPQKSSKTIFMVGGCMTFGYGNEDKDTSSSYLQQQLNLKGFDVRVENYGSFLNFRREDLYRFLFDLPVKSGDVVVFESWASMPDICSDYMDYIDLSELFYRPHNYSDVFLDTKHLSYHGQKAIAEKIFERLKSKNFYCNDVKENSFDSISIESLNIFGISKKLLNTNENVPVNMISPELSKFVSDLINMRKNIGAIVMNCNPFTLGHKYLIEQAAGQCVHLYVFVVEEDKSVFKFDDRIRLVKEGTADLNNVTVTSSGKFMISALTFADYFNKSELQDKEIDPSMDVEIFAGYIAPALGINVRFAGEEPLDKVTKQYNDTMRQILPKHGIKFVEIPRVESNNEVISASRVRKLLEENKFGEIAKIVPETTLQFLENMANDNVL